MINSTNSKSNSTGGVITFTKTGLIHKAGKAYSGAIAQSEKQPKKG